MEIDKLRSLIAVAVSQMRHKSEADREHERRFMRADCEALRAALRNEEQ